MKLNLVIEEDEIIQIGFLFDGNYFNVSSTLCYSYLRSRNKNIVDISEIFSKTYHVVLNPPNTLPKFELKECNIFKDLVGSPAYSDKDAIKLRVAEITMYMDRLDIRYYRKVFKSEIEPLITNLITRADEDFEEIRKKYMRGGRGKNNDEELKWVPLNKMSNSWLENCIDYNSSKKLFLSISTEIYHYELQYRKAHNIIIED